MAVSPAPCWAERRQKCQGKNKIAQRQAVPAIQLCKASGWRNRLCRRSLHSASSKVGLGKGELFFAAGLRRLFARLSSGRFLGFLQFDKTS